MRAFVVLLFVGLLAGCAGPGDPGPAPDAPSAPGPPTGTFRVSSTAFADAAAIPRRHTCDAENVSPPLRVDEVPRDATHLALIMEDPDAPFGTVLHWTFWDVPANVTALGEGEEPGAHGGREGRSYRGPCPPAGSHRYFFDVYATTQALGLPEGGNVADLRAALETTTAAQARMHGTYMRPNLG